MDPINVMIPISGLLAFLSVVIVSAKTGDVSYSFSSTIRKNRPKFKVAKGRVIPFLELTASAYLLNIVFGLVVVRDVNELAGIALYALFNTVFITYALVFWVLLEEKKQK